MSVQELPKPVPISVPEGTPIEFKVEEGTLYAKPNGGSRRFHCGAKVTFQSAYYFTLQFTQLGGSRPRPWNVEPPKVVNNLYVLTTAAPEADDDEDAPYYKYTATVGALLLDPIVIVDKR
jgi:hypothetical protein